MADEFKHLSAGTSLTQGEYEAVGGHVLACQETGDIVYASSGSQLSRLGKGAANTVLAMGGSCIPAWTASPSVTDLTIGGGCITLSAATDIDLLDNTTSALSFDASGKAGIIGINTNNCSEGVTMSGTLTVGVDDTGADVKFFGASAGAYMEWDESANLLEVRGATAAGPGHLKLTTGEATVVACDVLGKIEFQAPAECGTDAITVAARIEAKAQGTFSATVNSTDLIFYTGHSEAATEKVRITSQGEIGIGGANYGTDGQVLTSGGAGAAPAWEDAAGGGITINANSNNNVITATGTANCVQGEAGLTYNGTILTNQVNGAAQVIVARHGANACPANLDLRKSRNTTLGSFTAVADADVLGSLTFSGADSDSWEVGAKIDVVTNAAFCGSQNDAIIRFHTASGTSLAERARINDDGEFLLGETVNGDMTVGVTINQGANDDESLALKSSDIAHGVTNHTETDTYFMMKKIVPAGGGISMRAYVDDSDAKAFMITGVTNGVGDNAKSTSASGVVYVSGARTCGTGIGTGLTTSANLFTVALDGTTRFVVDKEGDVHYDGSTNATAWDDYCDVELLTATRAISMPDGTYFKNQFSGFISDYSCILERTGVVHLNRDTDSIPFVSTKALNGLIIDSVRQLHGRIETLETQLTALQGGK